MDAELKRALGAKVRGGQRLTHEDGVALYGADDLAWLGTLAHEARAARHGDAGTVLTGAGAEAASAARPPAVPAPDGDWTEVERLAGAGDPGAAVLFPYSRGEAAGERVERLLRLRALQDGAGGLAAVAPVRRTGEDAGAAATGAEVLKTFAVCRLLLDNVPHLTVRLDAHGELTALLALQHGADDLDPAAASGAPEGGDLDDLVELVRDAGLRPVERDARHAVLRTHEGPDADRRETPQPMRV
ncbi:hypothetical protein [Streptomyces sp. NPDC050560]|uniref:hypothetical protein n=1 Tax=Streptomyces sp. NPDC050560 TaxID=3365630 RepID=UPI00378A6A72